MLRHYRCHLQGARSQYLLSYISMSNAAVGDYSLKFRGCYITKTASTYLCNLAGTDYEPPEDDTIVSTHVGAV